MCVTPGPVLLTIAPCGYFCQAVSHGTTCLLSIPHPRCRAVQAGEVTAACLLWVSTAAHDLARRSTIIPPAKGPSWPTLDLCTCLCRPWECQPLILCRSALDLHHTNSFPRLSHPLLKCRGSQEFCLKPFFLSLATHTPLIISSTAQGCKYYPTC